MSQDAHEAEQERSYADRFDNCLEQGCFGPFGCMWFGLGFSFFGLLFVMPIWMR